MPPITPYYVMKVGHAADSVSAPGDAAVGELVAQRIAAARSAARPPRAVMLDRLGPNVGHESPAAASAVLEELEETAKLWLLGNRSATPLTPAQIDELRRAFGARW